MENQRVDNTYVNDAKSFNEDNQCRIKINVQWKSEKTIWKRFKSIKDFDKAAILIYIYMDKALKIWKMKWWQKGVKTDYSHIGKVE